MVLRTLALGLLLQSSLALGAGVGVQVDLNPIVPLGKKPTLNVVIKERLKLIEVRLKRSDGTVIKRQHKNPKRGTRVQLRPPQPEGTQHYTGEMTVHFRNGFVGKIPLNLTPRSMGRSRSWWRTTGSISRRLTLTVSRPCVRAAYKIISVTGKKLANEEELFETARRRAAL